MRNRLTVFSLLFVACSAGTGAESWPDPEPVPVISSGFQARPGVPACCPTVDGGDQWAGCARNAKGDPICPP